MAGSDMECGLARSVTQRSPRASCSSIRRRVGAARAAKVWFNRVGGYLTIWLTIEPIISSCKQKKPERSFYRITGSQSPRSGAATSLNLCRDLALALQQFVQGGQ